MDKPILGPGAQMRMVGRASSIEEANSIAQRYEAEGYETEIMKKSQAGLTVYEVWAGKKPDVFMGAPNQRM
jgi:hypothetical protein